MRNLIIGLLIGLILGSGAGAFGMLIAFPFLFPPAAVNEQIADIEDKRQIASGTFVHPDPADPAHWGKGSLEVYEGEDSVEIYLKPDFEVGPGPDFHVYLWKQEGLRDKDDFSEELALELGKLKSFTGSQIYSLAEGHSFDGYKSVVVWCKAFDQLITVADLE